MSEVRYERDHTLGLEKARELAKEWANGAARQMGLECQHTEGAEQDVLTFERMGVTGTMTVTGTRFELLVKLGLMMAAFKPIVEAEAEVTAKILIEHLPLAPPYEIKSRTE